MNKTLYASLLVFGILFYILGILQLVSVFDEVKDSMRIINTISSINFSFRVKELSVIEENPGLLHINGKFLFNATWSERVNAKGPIIRFVYGDNVIAALDIPDLSKPVVNKEVSFDLLVKRSELNESIYINISISTRLGEMSIVKPVLNVSNLLVLTGLSIEDVSYQVRDTSTYLSFYVKARYRVSIPIEVIIRDHSGKVIESYRIDKLDLKPLERHYVEIKLENTLPSDLGYIDLILYGVKIYSLKLSTR